jgi:hypothetical protein
VETVALSCPPVVHQTVQSLTLTRHHRPYLKSPPPRFIRSDSSTSIHFLRFIQFDSFISSHALRFISSIHPTRFCSFSSIHSVRYVHFESFTSFHLLCSSLRFVLSSSSSSSPSTVHSLRILRFCSFSSIHLIRFVHFELFTSFHLLGSSLRFVVFVTFSSLQSVPLNNVDMPIPQLSYQPHTDPNLIHICRYVRNTGGVLDHQRSCLSLYLSLFSLLSPYPPLPPIPTSPS